MLLFSPMNILPNDWRTEVCLAPSLNPPVSEKHLAQDCECMSGWQKPKQMECLLSAGTEVCRQVPRRASLVRSFPAPWLQSYGPCLGSCDLSHRSQTTLLVLTVAEENLWFMNGEFICVAFSCRASQLRKVSFWQNYCGYLTSKNKIQVGLWNK